MEEHEVPLDIYKYDLLGMEQPTWHQAEKADEAEAEVQAIQFSQKEKYVIVLMCVGFLYFSSLGVWLMNREVEAKKPDIKGSNSFTSLNLATPVTQVPAIGESDDIQRIIQGTPQACDAHGATATLVLMPPPQPETKEWSMQSHQALIDAYWDQERISAIDEQVNKRYDALSRQSEQFNNQVVPPPNWSLLRGSWSSIPMRTANP